MLVIRTRIHRLAALALLVWLFACGAALAQDCVTHVQAAASDCCTSMQAATVRAGFAAEAAMPAQPAQPFPVAAPAPLLASWVPLQLAPPKWPPRSSGGPGIPIVFLRLTL